MTSRISRSLTPARLAVWAVALTVYAGVALTNSRVLSSDTYLNLYAGRLIAAQGLPHANTLTLAGHGRPWIAQQWLSHLIYYEVWRVGGYAAIGALSAACIAAAFALLAQLLLRRGVAPARVLTWVVIAFFVCQPNTAIRAQSFAYPLFVVTLWLLVEDEREGWLPRMWVLLPLLVLWANVHGSVLLAAPLVAGAMLVRWWRTRDRRYAALAALAPACVLATPYGSAIISYYRAVMDNTAFARVVGEWQPTTLSLPNMQFIILCAIVAGMVVLALMRRVHPAPLVVALTIVLVAAGVHTIRYQAWAAFPAAVLATDVLSALPAAPARGRAPRPLAILAGAMIAAVIPLALAAPATVRAQVFLLFAGVIAASALLGAARAWQPAAAALAAVSVTATAVLLAGGQGTFTPDVSRGTVHALAGIEQRHPGAALLADDVTSGPLLWQMPGLAGKVAFDARLEVVSHAALDRYATFLLGGHGWLAATRGYGVVVVSRTSDPGLAGRMSRASGWSLAYRDSTDAVFVANRIRVNADKGRRS